jgi:hypothetical protein
MELKPGGSRARPIRVVVDGREHWFETDGDAERFYMSTLWDGEIGALPETRR